MLKQVQQDGGSRVRFIPYMIALSATSLAARAHAEVASTTTNGFELKHVADLNTSPAESMRRFEAIGRWWSPAHTYRGKAENLSLELKPGGCFCEQFPGGGGMEHMRVTYVDPGKRAVLTGALGPLLFEAATGVLDVRVEPAGTGTRMTWSYRVAGFARGGADKLAPLVDKVMAEQIGRLAR
jgi:uncharacterized protein YndB with AHSA1/START domain